MDKAEILRYIQLGRAKSVCIDCTLLEPYPGLVREVTIMLNALLMIEFNAYGYDEGGLTIKVYYDDYDQLIDSVQEFLGKDIEKWENFSRTGWYPSLEEEVDYKKSWLKLKEDLSNKILALPTGGTKYEIL